MGVCPGGAHFSMKHVTACDTALQAKWKHSGRADVMAMHGKLNAETKLESEGAGAARLGDAPGRGCGGTCACMPPPLCSRPSSAVGATRPSRRRGGMTPPESPADDSRMPLEEHSGMRGNSEKAPRPPRLPKRAPLPNSGGGGRTEAIVFDRPKSVSLAMPVSRRSSSCTW